MFSIITMASSTTKPVEMVSAISVRLLMLKPNMYIAAKVPTSESGTATPAMNVAASVAQEDEDDADDQADGQHQLELHVGDRGADGPGAVGQGGDLDRGGHRSAAASAAAC